jgi:hypothetical protein
MKIVIAVLIIAGALALGSRVLHRPAPIALHVPRTSEPIHIDAELEGKKLWEADSGHTGDLVDEHGQGMVPFTEAKARWGNGNLYLMLYAGDLDIESRDAFHLEIGGGDRLHVLDVSVLGGLTEAICDADAASFVSPAAAPASCDRSWHSRATVAVDRDGTIDQLGDNDEEWVVEMAIPLAALGLDRATPGTRLPFAIRRCDVGAGSHACGSWGGGPPRGELILD